MSAPLALLEPGGDVVTLLYIVSFSLFIFGIRRGTHPTTAKQGNLIAAGGMAIAVVATLLLDGIGNWGIIFGGLIVGGAVGVVASIRVQMTQMPQMVALYNGVGGGAVALIAWSEFRHGLAIGSDFPLEEFIPILFAAVIGSISFWGSDIAFGKLQDLVPTGSVKLPGQQVINALLLAAIVVLCVFLGINHADDPSELMFVLILIGAGLLGVFAVLPIGGADMPVVIALLNAATGLSAAAAGFSLDNVALIVAGTLVGSSGTILTLEMARAMNRSVANVLFAGFGGAPADFASSAGSLPSAAMRVRTPSRAVLVFVTVMDARPALILPVPPACSHDDGSTRPTHNSSSSLAAAVVGTRPATLILCSPTSSAAAADFSSAWANRVAFDAMERTAAAQSAQHQPHMRDIVHLF